jgi:hypothetical protein
VEFCRAVRTVNASLSPTHRIPVLAGDPPIDRDTGALCRSGLHVDAIATHRTYGTTGED